MNYHQDKIRNAVTQALREGGIAEAQISDITFHMTDWLSDLHAWHSFCERPESVSSDDLQRLLMNFLLHVPEHVAAASRLLTGDPVKDIFNVGAVGYRET